MAAAVSVLVLVGGCSSQQAAQATPPASAAPTLTPHAAASATPAGGETPVQRQALAPATDLPVADLCSMQVQTTADGRAKPLMCPSGAVNVLAWQFYSTISASILGLGLNPMQGQAEAAVCDDINHNHATRLEEVDGFDLAKTYYGWSFVVDPAHDPCV